MTVDSGAEVTLEANPEDVTADRREAWIDAGVTRVSVGVQSFADRELSAVGRRHDAARARAALATLGGRGLSLSGDLILGLPEQTAESFRQSVETLCESGVEHVSVYLLEAEKSKALEEDRRLRPERYLADDAQADLWLTMGQTLSDRSFRHYEISNWARAGREARHNTKYWQRAPTLGLGVSAHEFWRGRRRANVSLLAVYIERLARGERPVALDAAVGPEEEAAERIVLGLRLSAGVDRREIETWIAQSATRDCRLTTQPGRNGGCSGKRESAWRSPSAVFCFPTRSSAASSEEPAAAPRGVRSQRHAAQDPTLSPRPGARDRRPAPRRPGGHLGALAVDRHRGRRPTGSGLSGRGDLDVGDRDAHRGARERDRPGRRYSFSAMRRTSGWTARPWGRRWERPWRRAAEGPRTTMLAGSTRSGARGRKIRVEDVDGRSCEVFELETPQGKETYWFATKLQGFPVKVTTERRLGLPYRTQHDPLVRMEYRNTDVRIPSKGSDAQLALPAGVKFQDVTELMMGGRPSRPPGR